MSNQSSETIVAKYEGNTCYQCLYSNKCYEDGLPIDSHSMIRFIKRMGKVMKKSYSSRQYKHREKKSLKRKTTSFLTDSRLSYKMLEELVSRSGIGK